MTELRIETVNINSLTPDPANARKHDGKNLKAIASSLEKFGQRKPICVTPDSIVVAGNGTLEAAKSLGWTEIVIARTPVGWTWEQIRAFALADNRTAELAEWDDKVLADQLLELDANGWELEELGFQNLEPPSGQDDDDEPLSFDDAPKRAKLGDVWVLGNHRVICGDATDLDTVNKLVNGISIDMVFTDPPYGISHSGKGITANGVEGNDFGEILGDNDVSIAINSFNLVNDLFHDKRIIFWGANYYSSALPNGFGWIVWDKQREGDTFSGAELAFVNQGVKLRVFRHMWHGMVKASEHGQKRVHPTQKPTALAKWCFENYGNPKNVLDLFGGSGSTLIACEETNRVALLAELDPKYCDVIIKRWENLTGKTAELIED
jgi:16S rRNA G966 N2-methylase RsmD